MRRRRDRTRAKEPDRRHPLRDTARLKPAGPALERRTNADERERLTVQLPRPLIEQLRNAVYWTPGLTITSFLADCISNVVGRLEDERGDKFPQREHALRPGRPKSKPE